MSARWFGIIRWYVSRSNAEKSGAMFFRLDTHNFQLLPLIAKSNPCHLSGRLGMEPELVSDIDDIINFYSILYDVIYY